MRDDLVQRCANCGGWAWIGKACGYCGTLNLRRLAARRRARS